jgi:predicted transcriptional regulator
MPTSLDLDQELILFIENYVDSFVKWDVIAFFCLNPETIGMVIDIASRLGRKESDVEEALEELVQKGLLEKRKNEEVVYAYAPPSDVSRQVKLFVECIGDREKRLKILAKILRMKTGR